MAAVAKGSHILQKNPPAEFSGYVLASQRESMLIWSYPFSTMSAFAIVYTSHTVVCVFYLLSIHWLSENLFSSTFPVIIFYCKLKMGDCHYISICPMMFESSENSQTAAQLPLLETLKIVSREQEIIGGNRTPVAQALQVDIDTLLQKYCSRKLRKSIKETIKLQHITVYRDNRQNRLCILIY